MIFFKDLQELLNESALGTTERRANPYVIIRDVSKMDFPEVPTIQRGRGKDGKERIYILARNWVDIDTMCWIAGIPSEGIRPGAWYNGYERIEGVGVAEGEGCFFVAEYAGSHSLRFT